MTLSRTPASQLVTLNLSFLLLVACGTKPPSTMPLDREAAAVDWLPASVVAIGRVDITALRDSNHYLQLLELWKQDSSFSPSFQTLLTNIDKAYVGVESLATEADPSFYVIAVGSLNADAAVDTVNALLRSGALGAAAQHSRLAPIGDAVWEAHYGRVADDGKNTVHLERVQPGLWALSVGMSAPIRATTRPQAPRPLLRGMMDDVGFDAHAVAMVADTKRAPGEFVSASLVLDIAADASFQSRQIARSSESAAALAARLQQRLSEMSLSARLAGLGSLTEMIRVSTNERAVEVRAQIPSSTLTRGFALLRTFWGG